MKINPKKQKRMNKRVMDFLQMVRSNDKCFSCFSCTETHCCKNKKQISVSKQELYILKSVAKKEHIKRAKKEMEKRDRGEYYNCPFLSSSGKCDIYEVRPLSCSSYAVFSPPSECEDPEGMVERADPEQLIMAMVSQDVVDLKYVLSTHKTYDLLDFIK